MFTKRKILNRPSLIPKSLTTTDTPPTPSTTNTGPTATAKPRTKTVKVKDLDPDNLTAVAHLSPEKPEKKPRKPRAKKEPAPAPNERPPSTAPVVQRETRTHVNMSIDEKTTNLRLQSWVTLSGSGGMYLLSMNDWSIELYDGHSRIILDRQLLPQLLTDLTNFNQKLHPLDDLENLK